MVSVMISKRMALVREYEIITEAQAQLTSPDALSVHIWGEGKQLAGGGRSAVVGVEGGGERQGEGIWSSFQRQKVKNGLLLIIHILWPGFKYTRVGGPLAPAVGDCSQFRQIFPV
jgi:hypothetical protein